MSDGVVIGSPNFYGLRIRVYTVFIVFIYLRTLFFTQKLLILLLSSIAYNYIVAVFIFENNKK